MSNRHGYFNNMYYLPQNNKGLIALDKAKLTTHPNPTEYSPKTYQKIDIKNLLNSVFNPESCFKLFVIYHSLHKKH